MITENSEPIYAGTMYGNDYYYMHRSDNVLYRMNTENDKIEIISCFDNLKAIQFVVRTDNYIWLVPFYNQGIIGYYNIAKKLSGYVFYDKMAVHCDALPFISVVNDEQNLIMTPWYGDALLLLDLCTFNCKIIPVEKKDSTYFFRGFGTTESIRFFSENGCLYKYDKKKDELDVEKMFDTLKNASVDGQGSEAWIVREEGLLEIWDTDELKCKKVKTEFEIAPHAIWGLVPNNGIFCYDDKKNRMIHANLDGKILNEYLLPAGISFYHVVENNGIIIFVSSINNFPSIYFEDNKIKIMEARYKLSNFIEDIKSDNI